MKFHTQQMTPSNRYRLAPGEKLYSQDHFINQQATKRKNDNEYVQVIEILCSVPSSREQSKQQKNKQINSRFPRIFSKNQSYSREPRIHKKTFSRVSDPEISRRQESYYIRIKQPSRQQKNNYTPKKKYYRFYQDEQKYQRNHKSIQNYQSQQISPKGSLYKKSENMKTQPTFMIDIPLFKLDQIKKIKQNNKQIQKSPLAKHQIQSIQKETSMTNKSLQKRKCCSVKKQVGKIRKNFVKRNQTIDRQIHNDSIKSNRSQITGDNPLLLRCEFYKYIAPIKSEQKLQVKEKQVIFPSIPSKKNQNQFISDYVPINNQISIKQMKESYLFTIQRNKNRQQEFYFGQMKNDKKNGKGILIRHNMVFQGIWNDDQKVSGIQRTLLGTYKGQFVNDKRQGLGQFFWSHGQYYSGEWRNGKKNGNGYWNSNKGQNYMGQWKNGQVNGMGVHTQKDGRKYKGQFQNFVKHGTGREEFPNGDFYDGQYYEGMATGKGTYTWKNKLCYIGEFMNGQKHGGGVLKNSRGFIFEGKFLKDLPNGRGKITFQNGNTFEGKFIDGIKNGEGVYRKKKQGRVIRGYWKNDEFINFS